MKCFRVWPEGRVDAQLPVRMMDGTAYVPTGGAERPYISVDQELVSNEAVCEAGFEPQANRRGVRLVESQGEDRRALVLVPCSAAFNFRPAVRSASGYHNDRVAQLIVMEPGESIIVFPVPRSLADAGREAAMELKYDGDAVSFAPVH